MSIKNIILTALLLSSLFSFSQERQAINWLTVDEAFKANEENPKYIFIDVYTEWCVWCKRMDATTFKNKNIEKIMAAHFYAVKLDAETNDTYEVKGTKFINPNPENEHSIHQFASAIIQGSMSFPTAVVFNKKGQKITEIPGFHKANDLEPILNYFATEAYKTQTWEDYSAQ